MGAVKAIRGFVNQIQFCKLPLPYTYHMSFEPRAPDFRQKKVTRKRTPNTRKKLQTHSETAFQNLIDKFKTDPRDLEELLRFYPDYEQRNQWIVFLIGVLLTPVTLLGSMIGFVRSYNRFSRDRQQEPNFYPMHPITRKAMLIGAGVIWIFLLVAIAILIPLVKPGSTTKVLILAYLIANTMLSGIVFGAFKVWQYRIFSDIQQGNKFGSARFARQDELQPYKYNKHGIYIGGDNYYQKRGHILTCAGTRSGKFTNLIANNLLGAGDIDGSWVVIDPKGEIASVTGKYQREVGQNVVILNPWGLLENNVGASQSYNPLDILDVKSPHLIDDCQMIAEMLVPVDTGTNRFFYDSARAVIMGLILYIAIEKTGKERSLKTLWKIVRYPQSEWDRVLAEMQNSEDPINDENLLFASGEITRLSNSGGNTWGSILATVLQATEFLKSPALQKSLESGFDPKTLAHRNTTLYVIIPADKLQSHSRWLRLVVTSTMRAVIRKPNKRVVFMLDEFPALGHLPEIEIALGAYAGFNVTVWAIVQSLVQLVNLYEKNWQVFVGNSSVRHFFGIHSNFDADYISKAIGTSSHLIKYKDRDASSSARLLITPDELRIASGTQMFAFIDDLPPTYFSKIPYFTVPVLNQRAEKNPYFS